MDKIKFEKELKIKLKYKYYNKQRNSFYNTYKFPIFGKVKCYVEDQLWFDKKYLVFFEINDIVGKNCLSKQYRVRNIKELKQILKKNNL